MVMIDIGLGQIEGDKNYNFTQKYDENTLFFFYKKLFYKKVSLIFTEKLRNL